MVLVGFPDFRNSSNLTFSLAPGWLFVETEDWRPDLEGTWISNVGADESKYFHYLTYKRPNNVGCRWMGLHKRYMDAASCSPTGGMESGQWTHKKKKMGETNLLSTHSEGVSGAKSSFVRCISLSHTDHPLASFHGLFVFLHFPPSRYSFSSI